MKEVLKKLSPSRLFSALVCLSALLAFNPASAQEDADGSGESSGSKMSVGVRTGVTYSNFLISGSGESSERRVGFAAGAYFSYSVNQWLAVSPEVMFSQTAVGRVAHELGSTGSSYDYYNGYSDYRLNNVQINLLTDVRLPLVSVYKPKFYFGPSFDINAHAKANTEVMSSFGGYPLKFNSDVTNQFKNKDFGFIIGGGLDFDLKVGTLKFDARYRRGLTDINNTFNYSMNKAFENKTIHTNGLAFQVAFGYNL